MCRRRLRAGHRHQARSDPVRGFPGFPVPGVLEVLAIPFMLLIQKYSLLPTNLFSREARTARTVRTAGWFFAGFNSLFGNATIRRLPGPPLGPPGPEGRLNSLSSFFGKRHNGPVLVTGPGSATGRVLPDGSGEPFFLGAVVAAAAQRSGGSRALSVRGDAAR